MLTTAPQRVYQSVVAAGAGRRSSTQRSSTPDILTIVERAYDVESATSDWTRGLLDAADESLGSRLAGFACVFQVRDGALTIDRSSHAIVRQAPETVNAIFDGLTQTPPARLSAYLRNPTSASFCCMTSEIDPQMTLGYWERVARMDAVHDGLNISCMGLDGRGVLISLGVAAGVGLPPRLRRCLLRVATHLVAAQRLRRRVGEIPLPAIGRLKATESSGAILSSTGHLLHVGTEAGLTRARETLGKAVREIEAARRSSRSDPDRALNLWQGLVSARWTLVDQFDSDGRKHIIARENMPAVAPIPNLTPTENCVVRHAAQGYSTKEIAYTLGIKDATVRVLIMRAVRRLGVRDRRELLKLASTPATPARAS